MKFLENAVMVLLLSPFICLAPPLALEAGHQQDHGASAGSSSGGRSPNSGDPVPSGLIVCRVHCRKRGGRVVMVCRQAYLLDMLQLAVCVQKQDGVLVADLQPRKTICYCSLLVHTPKSISITFIPTSCAVHLLAKCESLVRPISQRGLEIMKQDDPSSLQASHRLIPRLWSKVTWLLSRRLQNRYLHHLTLLGTRKKRSAGNFIIRNSTKYKGKPYTLAHVVDKHSVKEMLKDVDDRKKDDNTLVLVVQGDKKEKELHAYRAKPHTQYQRQGDEVQAEIAGQSSTTTAIVIIMLLILLFVVLAILFVKEWRDPKSRIHKKRPSKTPERSKSESSGKKKRKSRDKRISYSDENRSTNSGDLVSVSDPKLLPDVDMLKPVRIQTSNRDLPELYASWKGVPKSKSRARRQPAVRAGRRHASLSSSTDDARGKRPRSTDRFPVSTSGQVAMRNLPNSTMAPRKREAAVGRKKTRRDSSGDRDVSNSATEAETDPATCRIQDAMPEEQAREKRKRKSVGWKQTREHWARRRVCEPWAGVADDHCEDARQKQRSKQEPHRTRKRKKEICERRQSVLFSNSRLHGGGDMSNSAAETDSDVYLCTETLLEENKKRQKTVKRNAMFEHCSDKLVSDSTTTTESKQRKLSKVKKGETDNGVTPHEGEGIGGLKPSGSDSKEAVCETNHSESVNRTPGELGVLLTPRPRPCPRRRERRYVMTSSSATSQPSGLRVPTAQDRLMAAQTPAPPPVPPRRKRTRESNEHRQNSVPTDHTGDLKNYLQTYCAESDYNTEGDAMSRHRDSSAAALANCQEIRHFLSTPSEDSNQQIQDTVSVNAACSVNRTNRDQRIRENPQRGYNLEKDRTEFQEIRATENEKGLTADEPCQHVNHTVSNYMTVSHLHASKLPSPKPSHEPDLLERHCVQSKDGLNKQGDFERPPRAATSYETNARHEPEIDAPHEPLCSKPRDPTERRAQTHGQEWARRFAEEIATDIQKRPRLRRSSVCVKNETISEEGEKRVTTDHEIACHIEQGEYFVPWVPTFEKHHHTQRPTLGTDTGGKKHSFQSGGSRFSSASERESDSAEGHGLPDSGSDLAGCRSRSASGSAKGSGGWDEKGVLHPSDWEDDAVNTLVARDIREVLRTLNCGDQCKRQQEPDTCFSEDYTSLVLRR